MLLLPVLCSRRLQLDGCAGSEHERSQLMTKISYTHVLHLYGHEFEPLCRASRETFTVDHETNELNVGHAFQNVLGSLQEGDRLLVVVAG